MTIEKASLVLDYLKKQDSSHKYFVKDVSYVDKEACPEENVTLFEIRQKKAEGSHLVARLEKSRRFGGSHTVSFMPALLSNAKLRQLFVGW